MGDIATFKSPSREEPDCGMRAVFRRECRRMTTEPVYLLLTLVLPLISFMIFWVMFCAGTPNDIPVSILDADNSHTSRRVRLMLDASPRLKVVYRPVSIEEGKKQIHKGHSQAVIVLPANLEKDLLQGKAPKIVNYYNNEFLLTGSLVDQAVKTVVKTASKGADLSVRLKKGEMKPAALAHIEPVTIQKHVLFNPFLNYLYYLVTALAPALLQIFIMVMTVFVLGVEIKQGTFAQLYEQSAGSLAALTAGKILPYTGIYFLLAMLMNICIFGASGLPFKGSLAVVTAATALFVLACQAVAVLFVTVAANLRLALSAAAFYSTTAFAFAGVTFPVSAMPLPARFWSCLVPLTTYTKLIFGQSMKADGFRESLPGLCILTSFILAGFMLSRPWMKRITDGRPGLFGRKQ